MQQRTMAAQAFLRARNRYFFFFVLPPFQRHFSPSVLVCVQAFISNLPLPQSQIDTSLLLQSWYQGTNPALAVHPLARPHAHTRLYTHTFCLSEQTNGSVCPHHPLSTPTHLPGGRIAPKRPRALHSPIWILLGKLAPNTAPRKLVQKKAKMCCIFPFALAKKKPSSKHRFDFSPALLSLAASLASPPLRLQGCASPSLGIRR